jgi:8-oxo-dGTP diphosphatase
MSWEVRLKHVHAVVGIIKRDSKILVGERPEDKPYGGYWEFPGGKVEENESGEQALKRELHEELGIDVITAKPWFEHTHAYPDKTVLLEMWIVTQFLNEPYSKENQVLRWVTLTEMMELRLLEGNLPILDRLKALYSRAN